MSRTNEFTEILVDYIDGRLKQTRFSNLWLGGGAGPEGGSSFRPIDGQITQRHVSYDTSEPASPCAPSGFSSLVDNLRRMRYWQEPATWFGVETTSGLQVTIKPGLWYPSTTEYCAFAGGDSPTFTLPGILDRIDTVYVDPSGILHIHQGTPDVTPTITLPAIASGIPLWAVHLTPTASGIYHSTCSGYYAGQGYIERDLRPFLNLGGGGTTASGTVAAATAEGQALVSNAALEWTAATNPVWIGTHIFMGPVGIGVTPDLDLHVHGTNSVTIKLTNDDTGTVGNVGLDIGVGTSEQAYMWNRENTELSFGTNNLRRMTILADGKIGINAATIPYGGVGAAMLALHGTDVSADGPHIQLTTDNDDYPLLQVLADKHDAVHLVFDAYYDYASWKSSDPTSNCMLHKESDLFQISWDENVGAGNNITWNTGLVMNLTNGNVGVGITPNQKLTVEGTIDIKEQAAANADTPAYGQIWVKDTTPNELWFTDDAGADVQLGLAGGGLPAVAGAGYVIVSTGVNAWAADQTPAWTGLHTFNAGASIAAGQGITMADDTWIGIGVALERIVFDNAGDISVMGANFGVGTLAPTHSEHIFDNVDNSAVGVDANVGGLRIQGATLVANTYSFLRLDGYAGDDFAYIQAINLANNNTALAFGNYETGGPATREIMRLTQTGRLGLGVVGPDSLLHMQKDLDGDTALYIENDTPGVAARALIRFWSNSNDALIGVADDAYAGVADWADTLFFNSNAGLGMRWAIDGTTKMTMDNTGKLGLATLVPSELLQLAAFTTASSNHIYIAAEGSDIGDFDVGIKLRAHTDLFGFTIQYESAVALQGLNIIRHQNSAVGVTAMFINRVTGYTGLGTTGPSYLLDVRSSTTTAYIQVKSTNSSAGVRIDAHTGAAANLYWLEAAAIKFGLHYSCTSNYLHLRNSSTGQDQVIYEDGGDTLFAPLTLSKVGIGMLAGGIGLLGKLHINQYSSTAAITVLALDQADTSEGFIGFHGLEGAAITESTNSTKSVRVALNGNIYRLALYANA